MWEIMKRKTERWDGESWFGLLLWMGIAGIMLIFFNLITADKMVRCYYLSSFATDAGVAYMIRADIDYSDDSLAFSSHDYKATMEVFGKLPQCPPED